MSPRLLRLILFGILVVFIYYFIFNRSPRSYKNYIGAGIFPIALRHEEPPVVLLGFDKHTEQWAEFGGAKDMFDSSPITCACRELIEETLSLLPQKTINDCVAQYKKYSLFPPIESHDTIKGTLFYQFYLLIDYDDELCSNFELLEKMKGLRMVQIEKKVLKWVELEPFLQGALNCCVNKNIQKCEVENMLLRPSFVRTLCVTLQQYPISRFMETVMEKGRNYPIKAYEEA